MDDSSLSSLSPSDDDYAKGASKTNKRKKSSKVKPATKSSRARKRRNVAPQPTLVGETQSSTATGSILESSLGDTQALFDEESQPSEERQTTKSKSKGRTKKVKEAPPEPTLDDFAPPAVSEWKIGAHVSGAGGLENAVSNAANIGANAFALFLKSNRKWESPPLSEDSISKFRSRTLALKYEPAHVLPHSTYLINMAHADDEKREKAYQCFADDLRRCEQLGLTLCNFQYPWGAGNTKEAGIANIAACLNRAHREFPTAITVIECMAGTKNVVGGTFKDLADIIELVEDKSKVGICLDTCHMFSAGYDLRTKEAYESTMKDFESIIGLQYLKGMHLNDSKTPFRSNKDRHENLGIGSLGIASFHHIVTDPRTKGIPLVLETPGFDCETVWRVEIEVLNRLSTLSTPEEDVVEEVRTAIREAEKAGFGAKGKIPKGGGKKETKKGKKKGESDEDDEMSEDE